VVVERKTDLGTQANLQDALATLSGSDEFYARASIPVDRLQWIECDPENGSAVTITRNTGEVRKGRAIRLESALEEKGRMARVLVAVKNPLEGEQPLLLNEYVRMEFEGSAIEKAFHIPRIALHDDRFVWLAKKDRTLEIREVEVRWRDTTDVIVSGGLKDGEQLILTNLSTPVNGMQLRLPGDPMPQPGRGGGKPGMDKPSGQEGKTPKPEGRTPGMGGGKGKGGGNPDPAKKMSQQKD